MRGDARKARHLLNRAGFGVPRGRWESLTNKGVDAAVQELVFYETQFESSAMPSLVLDNPSRTEMREIYGDAGRGRTAKDSQRASKRRT